MTITVNPLEKGFGAEIAGIDLSRPVSDEDRDAVYGAFLDHHLIIIRGQALKAEQVAAARILGDELEPHLFKHFHHPDTPLIMVLSNRIENGKPKGMADAGA